VSYVGPVDREWAARVLVRLRGLYAKVEEPPPLVYVVLVHAASSFKSHLELLHREAGVVSSPAYEGYEAAHDAYTGAPRLTLCLELLKRLPSSVADGIVLHEAAHTVLHGSLEAYMPPRAVVDAAGALLGPGLAYDLAYLASTAVKDYEASRLLVDLEFRGEAEAYVLHLLSMREGLNAEWETSSQLGVGILHLAELLKPLCCAVPLLSEADVAEAVEAYLSHLPSQTSKALRSLAEDQRWQREPGLWRRVEALLKGLAELKRMVHG